MPNTEVSITSAVSYKGIFDRSIYVQADYLNDKTEKSITESGLLECLRQKKHARLKIVLIDKAEQLKAKYATILDQGVGRLWGWLQPIAGAMPFINVANFDKMSLELSREEAQKEVLKLASQIMLLMDGLDTESIFELEKKYVLSKRKIKSTIIQEQIEKTLLLCREEPIHPEFLTKFIDNCLAMPTSWHRIKYGIKLSENVFFNNFDPKLLTKLDEVVTKLSFDSHELNVVTGSSRRCIYYFHGDAGAGKSQSARLIPEMCGLPYYVFSVKTIQDLSAKALEGEVRTSMAHNCGILAQALMSKNKQGKSCHNVVLIIEDFDRVLFPSTDGGDIPAALCFLLDYLDPEKKEFFNFYFQAMLDISGLSIFITANRPIPKKENYNSGTEKRFDPYAALRSRVTEVYFPNFSEQSLTKIMTPFAQSLIVKYNLFDKHRSAKWIVEQSIRMQKSCAAVIEPRDLKRQQERIAIACKVGERALNLLMAEADEAEAEAQSKLKTEIAPKTSPAILFQFMDTIRNDRALQGKLAVAAVGVVAADIATGGRLLFSMATGFGIGIGATICVEAIENYNHKQRVRA